MDINLYGDQLATSFHTNSRVARTKEITSQAPIPIRLELISISAASLIAISRIPVEIKLRGKRWAIGWIKSGIDSMG
jgi:hypothetical protein